MQALAGRVKKNKRGGGGGTGLTQYSADREQFGEHVKRKYLIGTCVLIFQGVPLLHALARQNVTDD
jgi:hypothetical protein